MNEILSVGLSSPLELPKESEGLVFFYSLRINSQKECDE